MSKTDLSPERVIELRDTVLALVEAHGTQATTRVRSCIKTVPVSNGVADLYLGRGAWPSGQQYVTVKWRWRKSDSEKGGYWSDVLTIVWQGDRAPSLKHYVEGPWLVHLTDLINRPSAPAPEADDVSVEDAEPLEEVHSEQRYGYNLLGEREPLNCFICLRKESEVRVLVHATEVALGHFDPDQALWFSHNCICEECARKVMQIIERRRSTGE